MIAQAKYSLAFITMQVGVKGELRREIEESKEASRDAQSAAQKVGDKGLEAKAVHLLATALGNTKAYDEAITTGEKALAMWRSLNYKRQEAWGLLCLADWSNNAKDYRRAEQLARDALAIYEELKLNKNQEVTCISLICQSMVKNKDFSGAQSLGKEWLTKFQKGGEKRSEVKMQEVLMDIYFACDNNTDAVRSIEKAVSGVRAVPKKMPTDKSWEAELVHKAASATLRVKNLEKADKNANDCLRMYKEMNDKQGEAYILTTLSSVQIQLKTYRDAIFTAMDAVEIYRETGMRSHEGIGITAMAEAYGIKGDWKKAIMNYKEALEIFQEVEDMDQEAHTFYLMGVTHNAYDKHTECIECAKQGRALMGKLGKIHDEFVMMDMEVQALFGLNMQLTEGKGKDKEKNEAKAKEGWVACKKAAAQALALARKSNKDKNVARALGNVGQAHFMMEEINEADTQFTEALRIARECGAEREEVSIQVNLGYVGIRQDDSMKAKSCARESMALAQKLKDDRMEKRVVELFEIIGKHFGGGDAAAAAAAAAGGAEAGYQGPTVEALSSTVSQVALNLTGTDKVEMDVPLMEAGLDSLAAVEFTGSLSKEFPGIALPNTLVFDYPSINSISGLIDGNLRTAAGFAVEDK